MNWHLKLSNAKLTESMGERIQLRRVSGLIRASYVVRKRLEAWPNVLEILGSGYLFRGVLPPAAGVALRGNK